MSRLFTVSGLRFREGKTDFKNCFIPITVSLLTLKVNISIAACFQLDVELVGLGGLVMLSQGSQTEVVSKLATRQESRSLKRA